MPYTGTFGSVEGVNAYVRHMTFGAVNNPKVEDVGRWLDARSAQLIGWLAGAGYKVDDWTPYPQAKAVLDDYANRGGACSAELSQRHAGYEADSMNQRENKFCREFSEAEAWIMGRALAALGVPQVLVGGLAAEQPAIGIIIAGSEYDLTRRLPREWNT